VSQHGFTVARQRDVGSYDMNCDRVSIRLIDDLRPSGGTTSFKKGSELLVHTTTAAALVLSGAAIQLSPRLTS
jgi:hypothetical protein